ncbi:hypothetical protein C8J56DRAFT_1157847 [Mycena floridula]|nr:hypothetical protein C8J56DRAFT_1157847 [Mycena floridula]
MPSVRFSTLPFFSVYFCVNVWYKLFSVCTHAGTCLLISGEQHDIACLFTSRGYGRSKDSPDEILQATRTAIRDLLSQNSSGKEMHACRFNSGKFAVPWPETEQVLVEEEVNMTVYEPPESVVEATENSARALYRGRGRGHGRVRAGRRGRAQGGQLT